LAVAPGRLFNCGIADNGELAAATVPVVAEVEVVEVAVFPDATIVGPWMTG
jgi:hypothetical protein